MFAKSGGICFRSFEICRIEAITAWVRSGCRGHNNSSRMDNRPARERRNSLAAVISTRGGGTDRGSTNRSSTDAHRHARAYTTVIATTVNAATIDTTTIDATARDTSAIC